MFIGFTFTANVGYMCAQHASQGYPVQKIESSVLEQATEMFLNDLAGNAFPGTSMMACIVAAFAAVFRWREVGDGEAMQMAQDS